MSPLCDQFVPSDFFSHAVLNYIVFLLSCHLGDTLLFCPLIMLKRDYTVSRLSNGNSEWLCERQVSERKLGHKFKVESIRLSVFV